MKKILKTGVLALSCASMLLLCACSSASSATFVPNWYGNNTLTSAISDTYEKLVYTVTQEAGTNEDFSVTYQTGTYTVVLENTVYEEESLYKLSSELQIAGAYTVNGQTLSFEDSVSSECYFRNAANALYPVYSKKTVHSTSPRESAPASLEEGVETYDYTVEISYRSDGTAASVYTDASETVGQSYSLKTSLPVLDNESLLFAVRGVSLSSTTNQVYVLNPYNRTQETVNIALSSSTSDAAYSFLNVDNGDTEAQTYTMDVNTVQIYRDETLQGNTLTATYAAPVSDQNTYRCVMLELTDPLAYNLGSLVYTLSEADFTNK